MSLKLSMVVGAALAMAAAAVSAVYWDALPALVPTHFDVRGHANGYQARAVFAVLMPTVIALIAPLFALLVRISPRGWELRGSTSTVGVIAVAVAAFLLAIHVAIARAAVTHGEPRPAFLIFAVGALLATLGCAATSSSASARRGRSPTRRCGCARTGWRGRCSSVWAWR